MLNVITIMGRLTADPVLRKTQNNNSVATFTVAVDRDYGEKQTDFISCVAWRQTGEFVSKYFRKGSMICVTGRLQNRKYQASDGSMRDAWEINVDHAHFTGEKAGSQEAPAAQTTFKEMPADDGELPF